MKIKDIQMDKIICNLEMITMKIFINYILNIKKKVNKINNFFRIPVVKFI